MNVTSKLSPPLIQGCPHSSHQLQLSSITIFITSSIDSSPSSPFSSLAAAFHLTTLAPSFFFLLLLPLLPVVSCCPCSFVHPPCCCQLVVLLVVVCSSLPSLDRQPIPVFIGQLLKLQLLPGCGCRLYQLYLLLLLQWTSGETLPPILKLSSSRLRQFRRQVQ